MMATTIKVPLGSISIDNLRFDDAGASLQLINIIPAANETRVQSTANVNFHIVSDSNSDAIDTATLQIWLTLSGTKTLVYDGSLGGFQAGFGGSAVFQASPNAAVDDEVLVSINPTADFASEDTVLVEIEATANAEVLSTSYSFTVEATAAPTIDEVLWIDPRRARIRFRDPMQADVLENGTLFLQTLTGGIAFEAPDQIVVTSAVPITAWVGYWIGLQNSAFPQNNRYLQVTAVDPANKKFTVDVLSRDLKTDDGVDTDSAGNIVRRRTLRGVISSYRIEQRTADETITTCAYEPVVTSVRAAEVQERPASSDATKYIIMDFHDDISIARKYRIHTTKAVNDLAVPADVTSTFDFTSSSFGSPSNRIQLWDLFPEMDKDEDLRFDKQLRKMSCVLQDALNVLWHRCDNIATLTDPDLAPRQWIDFLLYTMGNPFRLSLNELEKRKLIAVLVDIYKRMGTKKIIEDTLAFFLGISFVVRQILLADYWELGVDTLGVDATLGPDAAFARNAYEIVSPVALTAEQRRKVTDIANTLDPVYMHLVGIVEP